MCSFMFLLFFLLQENWLLQLTSFEQFPYPCLILCPAFHPCVFMQHVETNRRRENETL